MFILFMFVCVCSFLKNSQIYGLMRLHILVTVEKVQRFPNSLCTPKALQGTCPLMLTFSWFLLREKSLMAGEND